MHVLCYNKRMATVKRTKRTKSEVTRYDFSRKVKEPSGFFRWLTETIASMGLRGHKVTVRKHGMEGLQPPYFVIGTHHSYLDLKTMVKALCPNKITYVCSLDVLAMHPEWLMNRLGVIFKRKFVQDVNLLKNMRHAVTDLKNCALVLYPEAKFSLDGTNSYMPPSLGKLSKYLGVPVVVANMHGNYVSQPQWNRPATRGEPRIKKGTPLVTDLTLVATAEEVKALKSDEIQARIENAMRYDDFAWQKENNVVIDDPHRAEGLHKLLYKCPHCGAEFCMDSFGTRIKCRNCDSEWELTELGELKGINCETVYPHIPDWFAFQKDAVRREVEAGTYRCDMDVKLCTMPYKKMYEQGTAHFVQTPEGITLTGTAYGEPFTEVWKGNATNGLHIEYNHLKTCDAFEVSTLKESYWCFTESNGILTKLSLATDEIYRMATGARPALPVIAATPEDEQELAEVAAAID